MSKYADILVERLKMPLTATAALAAVLPAAATAQTANESQKETLSPITVEDALPEPLAPVTAGAEELERVQPQTLREVFADQPAVTVSGGSVASQKLHVHGVSQNKLNVTIDGASQRNNVWHHNGNLFLDPSFLKSAEVNPGVAPADAGFGALGGSVAFETKDAADLLLPGQTVGGQIITSYDTNSGTVRGTLAGYGAAEGFDLLGIVTRAQGDSYENGLGYKETGTDTDLIDVLGKLGYQSPKGHRIEVSAEHLNDDTIRRLRTNMGYVSADLNRNDLTRTTLTAQYATVAPSDMVDPELSFYYNNYDLRRPNESGYTAPSGDFNSEVETVGGKAQNTFRLPLGALTVGVDFSHDDIFVERFHFSTDASEEISQTGLFTQFRFQPVARLNVSAGLRGDVQRYKAVDGQTFDNAGLTPNISAEYVLTDQLSVFGGYSRVWGGLEPAEAALFHARDYTYAEGLKPATAHNFRLGVRRQDRNLQLEASLFRTLMKNVMDWDYTTNTRINGDDLETKGIDLAATYAIGAGAISAKYTHTDITYGDRIALPGDFNMGTTVGDILTLSGYYTFEPVGVTVGALSEHAFAFDHEDLTANGYHNLDGYSVIDLFAEWVPEALDRRATLRVEVNNLLDADYVARATFNGSSRAVPVYEPGRSLLLSTTVRF